ncbi:hypothetical protein [Moraxella oblonga]|uniref:hypothetical protein n=1 Tax=Moraxella oblonga TaxID=200413 RepID=UPI000832A0E8|nr:hypothetical protein [Moraxella oblonga]
MFAFVLNVIIILVVMKLFFKFMYPKPPKHFFPQEGDDTTLRTCSHCGHTLATYRGILVQGKQGEPERFFCNDEHQTLFEQSQSPSGKDVLP